MIAHTLSNGITIVNVTPHDLTFVTVDGGVEAAPRSGAVLSAAATETLTVENGVEFVTPTFMPSPDGEGLLAQISQECPGVLVVGSLIAAQAYPRRVVAMVAAPGFERVPPAEKRMRPDRFTRY